jgi:type II secretion system protein D
MRLSVYIGAVLTVLIAAVPATAQGPATGARVEGGRLVTLDYANADVSDVLRALAAQSKVNIALNPSTKSLVTVHLRDKTVEEAILVVANMAGLGARVVNGTYVVAPRAEMRQALERLGANRVVPVRQINPKDAVEIVEAALPDVTARAQAKNVVLIGAPDDLDAAAQIIQQSDSVSPADQPAALRIKLKNRTASSTATSLTKMISGLSAEAAGDSVVVSGTRAEVDRAMRAVEMLDVPSKDAGETRTYIAKYVMAGQLVQVLQQLAPSVQVTPGAEPNVPAQPKFNILSGQVAGVMTSGAGANEAQATSAGVTAEGKEVKISSRVTMLLLTGTPADLDAAVKILERVDIPPKQVLIETKIVETSPELAENIGVKWSWDKFKMIERPAGTATDPTTHIASDESSVKSRLGSFSRIPMAFSAELSAMIRSTQSKLLANPRLTVLNDEDASFFVGDTIRVHVLAQSSATAGSQYTVLEVPVGIVLLVHPRMNDDANISLRIHPVVSTLTTMTDSLPQTAAREADTSVRLKDGDTVVISGLIQDSDSRVMQKVPFLGDLPIVGALFRNTDRTHKRTEIMVFLTVHILPN